MLNVRRDDVVFIGSGKCGNNIVDLIAEMEKYGVLAVNSANGDLNNLLHILPEDRLHYYRGTGAGSNREKGKEYAITDMPRVFDKLDTTFYKAKYVYIIASTAGGTGSGSAIEMAREIALRYAVNAERIASNGVTELPVRMVKVVAITPSPTENLSPINYQNNLDFLKELKELDDQKIISGYTILCNSKMDRREINEQFVQDIDEMLSLPTTTDGYGEALDGTDLDRMLSEGHGMFHMSEIVIGDKEKTHIKPCSYMTKFTKIKGCDHIAVAMSMDVVGLDSTDEEKEKWVNIAKGHYGDSYITNKLGVRVDGRNMLYSFGLRFPEQVVEEAKAMLKESVAKREQELKKVENHTVNFDVEGITIPSKVEDTLDSSRISKLSKLNEVKKEKKEEKKMSPLEARLAKIEALKKKNK